MSMVLTVVLLASVPLEVLHVVTLGERGDAIGHVCQRHRGREDSLRAVPCEQQPIGHQTL
jgi:hypothetical protein